MGAGYKAHLLDQDIDQLMKELNGADSVKTSLFSLQKQAREIEHTLFEKRLVASQSFSAILPTVEALMERRNWLSDRWQIQPCSIGNRKPLCLSPIN